MSFSTDATKITKFCIRICCQFEGRNKDHPENVSGLTVALEGYIQLAIWITVYHYSDLEHFKNTCRYA